MAVAFFAVIVLRILFFSWVKLWKCKNCAANASRKKVCQGQSRSRILKWNYTHAHTDAINAKIKHFTLSKSKRRRGDDDDADNIVGHQRSSTISHLKTWKERTGKKTHEKLWIYNSRIAVAAAASVPDSLPVAVMNAEKWCGRGEKCTLSYSFSLKSWNHK